MRAAAMRSWWLWASSTAMKIKEKEIFEAFAMGFRTNFEWWTELLASGDAHRQRNQMVLLAGRT